MKKVLCIVMIMLFAGVSFAAGPFPNKQFGENLGKDGRSYNHLYLKDSIILEGSTSDGYETTLIATNPTADRTITFPNSSGTVVLDATNIVATAYQGTWSDVN